MDLSVVLGMLAAIASLSIGDILEGGNPLGLIHLSSILIVIPTALANAMTGTDWEYVKGAFKELKFVFKKPSVDLNERIKEIIDLAIIARRDGLLALEQHVPNINNDFFQKALGMAVDGLNIDHVESTLEVLIEEMEEYYHAASHYWILAGETCPVMGLVGAVMGLILALQKLDNPTEMAEGIAGAFTATVTGISGAYMFIGPIGNKLKGKSRAVIQEYHVILIGVLGIMSGDNPRNLETKLFHYLSPLSEKRSQFD